MGRNVGLDHEHRVVVIDAAVVVEIRVGVDDHAGVTVGDEGGVEEGEVLAVEGAVAIEILRPQEGRRRLGNRVFSKTRRPRLCSAVSLATP